MTDVSIVGAVLAGLVSFLSPCVLPLVPGYVSMLSGIGLEQLRQGQHPRAGFSASGLAFVAGFSSVFISFGASASVVGQFLRENRALLAPVAGALILLFWRAPNDSLFLHCADRFLRAGDGTMAES